MTELQTDYLVIGGGATGMALVDALIASDDTADVIIVDRRHAPGGHWVDAYPFVQLHQPSAYYGINSLPLGTDTIDSDGINAGFYERATGAELRRYYEIAMERLTATGRVRFMLSTAYEGSNGAFHVTKSMLTGTETHVRLQRRLINATYIESIIPSTHSPSYAIESNVRHFTPNDLVRLRDGAENFAVLGGGKTAMDTCYWLLQQGVDPDAIQWVRPRDGWFVDRKYTQPHDLVTSMLDYQARTVESAALASSGADFARRLEDCGMMCRLDTSVEPEIFRGATVARGELDLLREIENVVRLGRVESISSNTITLTDGTVATTPRTAHINCTAQGLATSPVKPMFDGGALTVQFTTLGVAPWSAATIGFVESLGLDDVSSNELCPVVRRTGLINDQLSVLADGFQAEGMRRQNPDVAAWAASSRLNPMRALPDHLDDPEVAASMAVMAEHLEPAITNLMTHASRP